MKILIISNMYPSIEKPYAGIFVKNQFEFMKSVMNMNMEIFFMRRIFTTKFGSLMKYMRAFVRFTPFYFRKYDLIHVHFFYPLFLLAYLYKIVHPNAKIVVTFHGGDVTRLINGGMNQALFSYLARKSDYIISVGKDLSDIIEKKLSLHVDSILSAGVDSRVFYREPDIEKKYDFIFVGSFFEAKGVDFLVDAIKKIGNRKIRFCFVGSGPYAETIRELSHIYSVEVRENQTQAQLRRLYNESRFLLFPSKEDAFGLVVTESLYCGTPVVVSPIGGLKDQVVNGVNGFLLSENTSEEIIRRIDDLMNIDEDEYLQLSINAEKSNSIFSLETICHELVRIYGELNVK